jgi:hypothetical protein
MSVARLAVYGALGIGTAVAGRAALRSATGRAMTARAGQAVRSGRERAGAYFTQMRNGVAVRVRNVHYGRLNEATDAAVRMGAHGFAAAKYGASISMTLKRGANPSAATMDAFKTHSGEAKTAALELQRIFEKGLFKKPRGRAPQAAPASATRAAQVVRTAKVSTARIKAAAPQVMAPAVNAPVPGVAARQCDPHIE